MSQQKWGDAPMSDGPIANLTAITATTETGMWNAARYTPVPAGDSRAGTWYRVFASGIYSTGASGTLTLTPRMGTTTGGTTLGASVAMTVPINLTNQAWTFSGELFVRTIGDPGANSTVMFGGALTASGVAGTAASNLIVACGGTSATIDLSVTTAFFMGWTLSVAGSVTPQIVTWEKM